MIKPVAIGNRVLEVPIIQGGMGVGVSLSSLCGAVMREGGMGVISAAHPGYRKENFWKDSINCNCEALAEEIQKAKQNSQGNGICAVNIMVAGKHYDTYVEAAIKGGVDAIISGAGLPMHLPAVEGTKNILLAPIVSSARAIRLILKTWDRHHDRIPDFVVVEGFHAGGHLGFKKDDILNGKAQTLEAILPEVFKELQPYEERINKKIPVFVAGGIFDGEDIKKYLALGASGVQMATRFIATYECDASDAFKQVILNSTQEQIELVGSPAGLPGRAVLTPFMKEAKERRIPPTRCIGCMHPCIPASTPYCISDALIHAVQGDVEHGLVFAGSNAHRIHKLMSVHELMEELLAPLR